MSKIDRFFGKDETAKIKDSNGEEVEIKIPSLRGNNLRHVMRIANATDANKNIDFDKCFEDFVAIYNRIMKHNFPDASNEDLENSMTMENFTQIMTIFSEKTGGKVNQKEMEEMLARRKGVTN